MDPGVLRTDPQLMLSEVINYEDILTQNMVVFSTTDGLCKI